MGVGGSHRSAPAVGWCPHPRYLLAVLPPKLPYVPAEMGRLLSAPATLQVGSCL